jgi:hypothetical protein
LDDISLSIEVMKTKYQSVLAYFGEEATLPSQEFFSTLEKFVKVTDPLLPPSLLSSPSPSLLLPSSLGLAPHIVQAFIEEREINERLRKAEEKKTAQDKQRRATQVAAELDPSAKSLQQRPESNSSGREANNQTPPGGPMDRRRQGPGGAMMARRNSSYM